MPHPSPRFSTEGGLEIEKTDSTTVKTIAEPYFLASVNFYRTAIITYNDLYKFLSDHKNVFDNDANFTAFYDAMFRHTHNNVNDYLYYEMQEKFFRRIIYYQNQRDTK